MSTIDDIQRRAGSLIVAISLGYFMVMLDMTVLTVALPPIRRDLGGGIAGLQWVVDGYVLVFAALLLTAGSLADRIGARRTFLVGCWLFAGASALAGAAPSLIVLIVLRALQGVGAALLLPASMALIARGFPDAAGRARALGSWAAISGCALAAGPLAGGALVGTIGWRAIFFINLPVAGLGAALTARLVPRDPAGSRRALDVTGQLSVIVGLAALTFGFSEAARGGFGRPDVVAAWVVAALAFVVFGRAQHGSDHPMLPPRLLGIRTVAVGMVAGALVNVVLGGALFVLPLAFEQGRGWSPLVAGLAFLPLTLPTAFNPLVTGRLVARVGSRGPITAGFALTAAGCALEALACVDGPYAVSGAGLALLGFGISLVLPALIAAVVGAAPAEHVGVASGALNASRQVGATVAVAVTGAVLAGGDAQASAAPVAMGVLAVGGVVGCGLGARLLFR
jgi:MFS transporter, DHA2 family, methylenomycin A resistance protein